MRVFIPRTEAVDLPQSAMKQVTKAYLLSMVAPGEYLRTIGGKVWVCQDDPEWRHGSVDEEVVREATQLDVAVFKVLETLNAA